MRTMKNPKRALGDKTYDSDQLDAPLAQEPFELIATHRENRKLKNVTRDGRPPRRYKRHWTVERKITRIQHCRRLCIR